MTAVEGVFSAKKDFGDEHVFSTKITADSLTGASASGAVAQPHFRYYQQRAAEFYQPFIMGDATVSSFASADYRLGEMTAYTIGIKYGIKTPSGNERAFRLEYYQ